MRFFTTEGPVNCVDHYCLPPLARFDLADILALIAQKKYFLLHVPRQTGKTTCLLALADYLNQTGAYHAVYANIEPAQAWREDVAQGMATAVTYIATSAADADGRSGCASPHAGGPGNQRAWQPPGCLPDVLVPAVGQAAGPLAG